TVGLQTPIKINESFPQAEGRGCCFVAIPGALNKVPNQMASHDSYSVITPRYNVEKSYLNGKGRA
ncbi:MAG: hypothetical protein KAR13_22725, partial [Desulfobulbaceae bacterium]|nr:hypothetical protein [Desulfobulbaceae bacterium]